MIEDSNDHDKLSYRVKKWKIIATYITTFAIYLSNLV